jgi:hypothetical protein
VLSALAAAIKALPGVSYGTIYENDTNATDANGLPAHSISAVVKGGVAADIAQTIYDKKSPGVATYGTTTIPITDLSGTPRDIKFTVPTEVAMKVNIELTAGVNYTTAVAASIKEAVAASVNALAIGDDVIVNRLMVPALLNGAAGSTTYTISTLTAAVLAGTLATTNITVAYTDKATLLPANVTIVVL